MLRITFFAASTASLTPENELCLTNCLKVFIIFNSIFYKKAVKFGLHFLTVWTKSVSSNSWYVLTCKYMRILCFCLKNSWVYLHTPNKLWQFHLAIKTATAWNNVFTMIELCICTSCSNVTLSQFFSQMRITKTDWPNPLSIKNLTSLVIIFKFHFYFYANLS